MAFENSHLFPGFEALWAWGLVDEQPICRNALIQSYGILVGDVVARNLKEITPAEMMAWLDRKKAELSEGDNLDGAIIEAIKEIIEGHGDDLPAWEDGNTPWNHLP